METAPDRRTFIRLAKSYNLIPIYREVLADLETPVSCYMKTGQGPYSFLLESVEGGQNLARYSFIGIRPSKVFESRGRRIRIRSGSKQRVFLTDRAPLDELQDLMSEYRQAPVEGLPPFSGGAVGFMGYEAVRFFEKLPDRNREVHGIPDMLYLFTDVLLAFDHAQRKIKVICNVHLEKGDDPGAAYDQAVKKLETIVSDLRRSAPVATALSLRSPSGHLKISSNFKKEAFCRAVTKAKRYIRIGDIFQVVLSQAFQAAVRAKPLDIYRALRSVNPSPYMFFIQADDFQLIGSSPEVHVRYEQGKAFLRPIAGTRPRGKDEKEDARLANELLADPKERAEHLMLVDLGRNDLGRVCEYKSVKVPEFMVVEKYSHVMHIVSLVEGRLKKGRSPFDLLKATFPAGTVSGAPKVRAMEIIDELENQKRSFYSGIVGYFSYSGNLDSCITIRTILVQKGKATVQAGAGVVADSKPEREYQETVNKAKALFRAIEIAESGERP